MLVKRRMITAQKQRQIKDLSDDNLIFFSWSDRVSGDKELTKSYLQMQNKKSATEFDTNKWLGLSEVFLDS